jgi:hypothetical protein
MTTPARGQSAAAPPTPRPRPRPGKGEGAESSVLALQRTAGNAAVAAHLQRDGPMLEYAPAGQLAGATPAGWNARRQNGRNVDPERPVGILPFTADGWSGLTIASRMSQLDLAVRASDAFSCVEAATLVELVQRGPGAVRSSIAGYLVRYRKQLDANPTQRLRTRLEQSASFLQDALSHLDERAMTYQDLAQLRSHMYLVRGSLATRNTLFGQEDLMLLQERYTEESLDLSNQSRADVAALAVALRPGQFLSCGIDAQGARTGTANHNVHIARTPTGTLGFYDPWPRAGSQVVFVSPDLHEIDSYFVDREGGRLSNATFDVRARFTPPAGEQP